MPRTAWVLGVAVMICQPALADGMRAPRYRAQPWFMLPPERHVIEVVQPPWSGNFIINGRRFTANYAGLPALGGGRARSGCVPATGTAAASKRSFYNYCSAQHLRRPGAGEVDGFSRSALPGSTSAAPR